MTDSSVTGQPCLVITGASRGIGQATAERFLEGGFRVVNLSRSAPLDGRVEHLPADLFDPDWEDELAGPLRAAVSGAGRVVLVHNAALQPHGGVPALEAAVLRRALELNVVAPSILNRLLLPEMPVGSSVLYVGSTLSLKATANVAAYVASKHALLGLMRATCQDLVDSGVHTACVCPGFTDTEMLRGYGGEVVRQLARASAMNRLVKPEEVAESLFFCAGNPAVNGTVLRADLGLIEP